MNARTIAELAVLNGSNKLIGPELIRKANSMKQAAVLSPFTDAEVEENARAAAARGAAMLDARDPNWVERSNSVIVSDIVPSEGRKRPSNFYIQLGVVDISDNDQKVTEEDGAKIDAFHALRPGEERFVSKFKSEKEATVEILLSMMLGIPSPFTSAQEMSLNATKEPGEIDVAYYGFLTNYVSTGLGKKSSYNPTEAEKSRKGFCIKKAGRALAAAWTAEVAKRKAVR